MKTNRFVAGTGATPTHIAQALLRSNMSIGALRAMSPFQEDAQRVIDQAVVNVGLERLTVFADVLAEGLTYPLSDPLSVMEIQWESISRTGGAQRTMNPSARGENQLPARSINRIPIYLTTDDFSIGIRTLKMTQRIGAPLDVSLVEQATRRVNEALEDALINGAGLQVEGYTTPGLLDAPDINTDTFGTNGTWTTAAKTGENILDDVFSMVDMLVADKKYGPYNLYVPTAFTNKLNSDFKANGSLTILQRLQGLTFGGRPLKITPADMMPANTGLMIQMTSDVVDIITGQSPTVVPWTSADGFTLFWMVMAIMVPRVRSDYEGNSGICKITV